MPVVTPHEAACHDDVSPIDFPSIDWSSTDGSSDEILGRCVPFKVRSTVDVSHGRCVPYRFVPTLYRKKAGIITIVKLDNPWPQALLTKPATTHIKYVLPKLSQQKLSPPPPPR